MSCLYGLFYRNNQPVSNELELMYQGIQHFPHQSHNHQVVANCGFGHLLEYNTPEAVYENMPQHIKEANLLFMGEGRIDNREELFSLLRIPANEQATTPDGDLILKAYLKYGEQCVDHLLGKWSLAAFHTDSEKLFIARDQWDHTAIDYYIDDKVIAFCSSHEGLLPLPAVHTELDQLVMARMLVIWPGEQEKTYFKNIYRLLPSHFLKVTSNNQELKKYWDYHEITEEPGKSLNAYCDDLLDSMNKAVAARLRSYKPVSGTLSGGMDSSTVCSIAAGQLAKQNKELKTYSHVPQFTPSATLGKNSFGDEQPFIETIAKMYPNINPSYLHSEAISPIRGIEQAINMYGEPFHAAGNAYWLVDIYKTAAQEGYGSILTGEFGNSTISWTGAPDSLPAQEIINRYGIKSLIKKKLLKPILYGPTTIGKTYKRLAFGQNPWKAYSYCTEAFENSMQLSKRIRESGFDSSFHYYFKNSKDNAFAIFDMNVMRLPFGAAVGYATGVELRDPTNDIRVMKSSLAIPNEIYIGQKKENKRVLRTMTKGILPDEVRLNRKKGKQSSDLSARLTAYPEEMDQILKEMNQSEFREIADLKHIEDEWHKLQADSQNYPLNNVFHFLRPVAAYVMWKKHQ